MNLCIPWTSIAHELLYPIIFCIPWSSVSHELLHSPKLLYPMNFCITWSSVTLELLYHMNFCIRPALYSPELLYSMIFSIHELCIFLHSGIPCIQELLYSPELHYSPTLLYLSSFFPTPELLSFHGRLKPVLGDAWHFVTDQNRDLGGPKIYGSGSWTLVHCHSLKIKKS